MFYGEISANLITSRTNEARQRVKITDSNRCTIWGHGFPQASARGGTCPSLEML